MGEREEEREARAPRVAAEDPALVAPVAAERLEVRDHRVDVERPVGARAPAAALVEAMDARAVVDHRRHRAEVVRQPGPAVAEDERDAGAPRLRPERRAGNLD